MGGVAGGELRGATIHPQEAPEGRVPAHRPVCRGTLYPEAADTGMLMRQLNTQTSLGKRRMFTHSSKNKASISLSLLVVGRRKPAALKGGSRFAGEF